MQTIDSFERYVGSVGNQSKASTSQQKTGKWETILNLLEPRGVRPLL